MSSSTCVSRLQAQDSREDEGQGFASGWRRKSSSQAPIRTTPSGNGGHCHDGRSPGSRISTSHLPSHATGKPFRSGMVFWKNTTRTFGNPLTVAGAATVLAPFGSSAPCSLLIPSGVIPPETVAVHLGEASPWRQDAVDRDCDLRTRGDAGRCSRRTVKPPGAASPKRSSAGTNWMDHIKRTMLAL